MKALREAPHCAAPPDASTDLLDAIAPTEEPIPLRHGAIYIARNGPADVVRVRSATGTLEIELTARGPRLRLQAVDLEIAAQGRVSLAGDELSLRSKGRLEITCEGQMVTSVEAGRYTRIKGPDRTEADTIEMQSNAGGLAIRAREAIAIDGERIGLNSLDLPQPFPWSQPASEEP